SLVRGFVEGSLLISDLDEPGFLRRLLTLDDRQCSVALKVQRLLITHRAFTAVLPDHSPRMRVFFRRPHGLASLLHPLRVESLGSFRGDRVDDLPIISVSPVPPKMRRQIMGCFRLPGSDDESQASIIEFFEVLR